MNRLFLVTVLSLVLATASQTVVQTVAQAKVSGLPAELQKEESRIESAVNREASIVFAEARKNCQSMVSQLSFKKRINEDLLLFDVRLDWADQRCQSRTPKNCQSIFSLKDGLVDLSCGEGDENWE